MPVVIPCSQQLCQRVGLKIAGDRTCNILRTNINSQYYKPRRFIYAVTVCQYHVNINAVSPANVQ